MKIVKNSAICVLLITCWYHTRAQSDKNLPVTEPDYHKSLLFSDLPDRLELKVSSLDSIFNWSLDKEITLSISDNFIFRGFVVSKSDGSDTSIQSIVIRSINRRGHFTFTRIHSREGIVYNGRIISLQNGDAFELKKENEKYYLIKKNLYDLISE